MPVKIGWPNPPAPISAPSVAVPTLITAALLMPARIVRERQRQLDPPQIAPRGRPSASRRFAQRRRDARQPGVRVPHDRQQAVEKQRRDGRASAADAQQRDHEHQQRQRRDRLDDAHRRQHDLPSRGRRAARTPSGSAHRIAASSDTATSDRCSRGVPPASPRQPRLVGRARPARRTVRRRTRRRPCARARGRASRGR